MWVAWSHTSLQPGGEAPSRHQPSARTTSRLFIETGPGTGTLTDPSTPRALSTAEVKELVALYAQAARNALDAGFDGVELHCANGYLVNQFISAHTNQRDDEYGGSLQNRLRFLREITLAVAGVVGKERVGVRFAPLFATTDEDRVYLGLVEDDPHQTYIEAVKILEEVGIAYLSLAEADWENAPELPETFREAVRKTFSGKIIYAGKYTAERGNRVIKAGWGDLIAFGRPFIANPDLPLVSPTTGRLTQLIQAACTAVPIRATPTTRLTNPKRSEPRPITQGRGSAFADRGS